jgi:hypothetical protein
MEKNTTDQYAYCGQTHPGSDDEARDWCRRYHRVTVPAIDTRDEVPYPAWMEADPTGCF